jgi:hypothetical protein
MSKMDNLRAMREARYAESQARATATASRPGPAVIAQDPPATVGPERKTLPVAVPDPAEPEPVEARCGHRNMSGRTCTREAGHAAKSHRYS